MHNEIHGFVSFSSREETAADFVRLLWSRLQAQAIRVFNYETLQGDITPGSRIESACKKEIDRANAFFAVVSDESMCSDWAKMEIEYALTLRRNNFIFPIILTAARHWPEPYNRLHGIKSLIREDINSLKSSEIEPIVERSVYNFCLSQGLRYFPLRPALDRLPLRQRLFQELVGQHILTKNRKAQNVEILIDLCDEFLDNYVKNNLSEAKHLIAEINRRISKEFTDTHIYYPRIVAFIVQLEDIAGDANLLAGVYNDVEKLANENNHWIDSNVFGLLGYISLLLGQPAKALLHYRKAETYLLAVDPALYHNKLLSAVLANARDEIGTLLQELQSLEEGMLVSCPRDFYRVRIVEAIALTYLGSTMSAFELLDNVDKIEEQDFDVIRQFLETVDSLSASSGDPWLPSRLSEFMESLATLVQSYSAVTWVTVVQRHAWLLYELGQVDSAARLFDSILAKPEFHHSVRLLAEGAVIHCANRDYRSAVGYIIEALAQRHNANQVLKLTNAEFEYFRGLAAWLIGKDEIAKDSYSRSGEGANGGWYARAFVWLDRSKTQHVFN